MAKFLHFAPVAEVRHVRHHGLKASRYKKRVSGVYCFPLLNFERTAVRLWHRILRETTRRGRRPPRLAGVVFEIDDNEMIYYFDDWFDNLVWDHISDLDQNLVSARQAERLAFEAARKNNQPLTPERVEQLLQLHGRIKGEDMPYYGLSDSELVVPRIIRPEEIIKVEERETRNRYGCNRGCNSLIED